jgi:lipoyl-dependent peroxiredoxin
MDVNGATTLVATEGGDRAHKHDRAPASPECASGTSPAELIAAAHADSFSLALCNELGIPALAEGETMITSTITLEEQPVGWTAVGIHLDVLATLPHVTQGDFIDATVRAKLNCLVSRMLRINISMNARLGK